MKGFLTFPMDICPKVYVIARLQFELTTPVPQFNHYTTTKIGYFLMVLARYKV